MASLVTFAKKLWKDATSGGTPITAAELNRMEGGINDCATQINRLGDSVSPFSDNIINKFVTPNNDSVLMQILFNARDGKEYGFTVRKDGVQLWDNTDGKTVWIITNQG